MAQWFVGIGKKQIGPLSVELLLEHRRSGLFDDQALVWRQGLTDWVRFADCELAAIGTAQVTQAGPGAPVAGAGYGGFWPRVGARLVDQLILLVVGMACALVLGMALGAIMGSRGFTPRQIEKISSYVGLAFSFCLGLFYHVVVQSVLSGTPGKRVFGLRLVGVNFTEVGLGQALGRHLAYVLAWLPFGAGVFAIAFDPRKQGWHDRMAGTVVVEIKFLAAQLAQKETAGLKAPAVAENIDPILKKAA
jgi:uncharacterized RDD family membrane protein YckC